LSPFWNKATAALLAALLLAAGCSSQPKRDGVADGSDAKAPAQPVELPRDYDNALVLMQSGDYGAAVPVLEAFIADHPQLAGPYINLGIAYQRLDRTDAALEALTKAVALNPANATAHHQLGILYREQGKFEAALEAYSTALKLDGGYALAHRNVGILYDLYLQQPAKALAHYRQYLELADNGDQQVNGWVIDLERRTDTATASR
jgi:tetratricopeptide (TPR) repeat protein